MFQFNGIGLTSLYKGLYLFARRFYGYHRYITHMLQNKREWSFVAITSYIEWYCILFKSLHFLGRLNVIYLLKREVTINFDEFSSVINSVIYFHFLPLNAYDIVYEFMYFLVRMVFKVATQRIKRNLV